MAKDLASFQEERQIEANSSPFINDGDAYAPLLQRYINRTLSLLAQQSTDVNQSLATETRHQLLQTLDLALDRSECWANSKEALLAFSPGAEQAGLRQEWILLLLRGIERAQSLRDYRCEARFLLYLGQLHQLLSQFELAKQYLSRSVELFAKEKLANEQATALNRLAYIGILQNNANLARSLTLQAGSLLNAEAPEMAYCLFVQGMAARAEEDWATSEEYLYRSLELRRTHGTARQIGLAWMNLGTVLRPQGKFDKAIQAYTEAITRFQKIDDLLYSATCQMNIGNILLSQNLYHDALTKYYIAEPVFRKLHHELRLANIYNNIGLAHAGLEQWNDAELAFKASAQRYQSLNNLPALIEVLYELVIVYISINEKIKARTTYSQSSKHLKRVESGTTKDRLIHQGKELKNKISVTLTKIG